MEKKPRSAFENVRSKSFVPDLLPEARHVPPGELVDMEGYRREERMAACGGADPIRVLVAYAQDELVYGAHGELLKEPDRATYLVMPRRRKFNKFGLAYRPEAKLWLHKTLADIAIGAAIQLHQAQGWTTALYDGLRTVDGTYNLYLYAPETDIASGLLALPGQSAHNKAMAVDSMMYDRNGGEVEMGGHFDHPDMETNSRAYAGDKIAATAKRNRLIREAAFLRSAFSQGLLIAPLRTEFWDDRLPENRADLWRVLDSAARCLGMPLLSTEDEKLRRENRTAFQQKWESWSYADFLTRWEETFKGHETLAGEMFGLPPAVEKAEFYHGNYHPIYDAALRESGKHLTEAPSAF